MRRKVRRKQAEDAKKCMRREDRSKTSEEEGEEGIQNEGKRVKGYKGERKVRRKHDEDARRLKRRGEKREVKKRERRKENLKI